MKPNKPNNQKRIFILWSFFFFLNSNAQSVTTLAGSIQGFADGIGTTAKFYSPTGVAVDAAGNLFVADSRNNRIRKITTDGVVSTFAGSGIEGFVDGTGTAAQFHEPCGVAVDGGGNVFVADRGNNRIRKITATGVVSTLAGSIAGFADGTGNAALFLQPFGLAVDTAGNVFVADTGNSRIRQITAGGSVTTLAGSGIEGFADGTGNEAQFWYPFGLALDTAGSVFVADQFNNRIRKITAAGIVSTLAGNATHSFADGTGTAAQFAGPIGVAVDLAGNAYVGDESNSRIRKITGAGVVTTFAGGTFGFADGTGNTAQFLHPEGVAVDAAGTVFVADAGNNRIRKITGALATANYQLENQVSVYPNPATSIINVDLEDITAARIIIFDLNGRELQTENVIDNRSTINISNLASGIYLMQISSHKGAVSKKIVKR